jgi:hypothetical protein
MGGIMFNINELMRQYGLNREDAIHLVQNYPITIIKHMLKAKARRHYDKQLYDKWIGSAYKHSEALILQKKKEGRPQVYYGKGTINRKK